MSAWKLKRTRQCAKCPWIVGVDPREIPNGYSEDKHRELKNTIARSPLESLFSPFLNIMACHEMDESYCIGWLKNQLGPGNNIGLRLRMMSCTNADAIRLRGEQHKCFEDTLP